MKIEFTKSIGFKMAAAITACLFVVIGIFSYFNVKKTEERLLKMAEIEASKMSNAIKSSFEHATLEGNPEMIQDIISTVGQQSMVEDIKILSINGQVKWARDKSDIGRVIDRAKEKHCVPCHSAAVPKKDRSTIIFENEAGRRILRNANPLENKKECQKCHNSWEKVKGILLVDFTMKDADLMMADSRRMLVLSAIAALLAASITCILFIKSLVGKPLSGLLRKMEEVEGGNLEAAVKVEGSDEIAVLGGKFNNMVSSMKECHARIMDEHVSERLTLFNIAEILDRSDSVDEASRLILDAINMGFGVEVGTIMTLKETGGVQLKGFVGLSEGRAGEVKDYIDDVYGRTSEVKDSLIKGEPFIVKEGLNKMDEFMVVPLKSSGRLVGAITIHRIRGEEIKDAKDIEELKKLFMIVSAQVSPYLFIGLCMDEKRTMKVSPFACFLDLISEHMERVREYNGVVSLAVIKIGNYRELCEKMGVDRASQRVQEAGAAISSAIENVHDATRITEIKFVLILPMTDKVEAMDIINKAVAGAGDDLVIKSKIVSYPEDGETPVKLMYLAYV